MEGAIPLSLANSGIRAALGKLFTWKFSILLSVIVLSVVFYRPFCKWLCPLGAFYAFPAVPEGMNSQDFCEKLLWEQKVAAVPGDAFGELGDGFFRCSYAASVQNIQKAVDRIAAFVAGAGSAG